MAGITVLLALSLAGCAASTFTEMPIIGEPANVPRASAEAPAYLAVHDMPVPRSEKVLDSAEQDRIQKELIAARDRQSASAASEAAANAREARASAERQARAQKAQAANAK